MHRRKTAARRQKGVLVMKKPGSWTIEGLFEGRPESLKLFNVVRSYIESLGPVKVEAAKTQVSFGAKMKFAWVWLPQTWTKKRPEDSITLTFDMGHRIAHDRIVEAVEPRPGRWTHHVIIEKASDLDDDVRAWLRESYELAQKRKSPSK
jgi:hypothetical protein